MRKMNTLLMIVLMIELVSIEGKSDGALHSEFSITNNGYKVIHYTNFKNVEEMEQD